MRLSVAMVTALSLLAARGTFAQAGGPSESEASRVAQLQVSQTITVTRSGSQPSAVRPAEHFSGSVQIDPIFSANPPSHTSGGRVTFEPGARTAWHSHPLGQTLIVTAGRGWVQQWGGQVEEIRQGDVVWIPPDVKHWHGATAGTSVTHIAIQESLNGKTVEWMEKVSDEQYGKSQATSVGVAGGTAEPAVAQKLFGDFDPKLAEITDNVLLGDVWERPGLSKHDRSLITVAALIALNRPEQLRPHLQRARANGVTKEEVIEVITHLAFYTGWPNAITPSRSPRKYFSEDCTAARNNGLTNPYRDRTSCLQRWDRRSRRNSGYSARMTGQPNLSAQPLGQYRQTRISPLLDFLTRSRLTGTDRPLPVWLTSALPSIYNALS